MRWAVFRIVRAHEGLYDLYGYAHEGLHDLYGYRPFGIAERSVRCRADKPSEAERSVRCRADKPSEDLDAIRRPGCKKCQTPKVLVGTIGTIVEYGTLRKFWCEQWIQSFGFLSIVFSESLGVSNNRSSTSFVEFISCRNHFFQVSSTRHCSQRKIGRTHRAPGISF